MMDQFHFAHKMTKVGLVEHDGEAIIDEKGLSRSGEMAGAIQSEVRLFGSMSRKKVANHVSNLLIVIDFFKRGASEIAMDSSLGLPSVIPLPDPYPVTAEYLFTVKIRIGESLTATVFQAPKGGVATIEAEAMEQARIKTKFLLHFKKDHGVVV